MTGSLRRGLARRAVPLLAGIALGAPLGAAAPALAMATGPAAPAAVSPVTFSYTGAEQTYTIPAGVTALVITAVGAPGGSGGNGASVTATVPLTALPDHTTTLYVEVGGTGGANPACGSSAGFNGGGCNGGGGASDVRTTSMATVPDSALTTANDSRLVVAGGGGAGGGSPSGSCDGGLAGDASASGAGNGGGAGPSGCSGGGNGGFGPGGGGAGSGGTASGSAGALGEGGAGAGGGGGGGYFGGGGGGYNYCMIIGGGCAILGGGGGGSSFWIPAATDTSMSEDTTGVAEVTISAINDWAGYAVAGKKGAFKSVSAAWTQPGVTCSTAGGNLDATFWVGLDGYNSDSFERIGTAADCKLAGTTESPVYKGWFELASHAGTIAGVVKPGDQMFASVTFSGTKTYTLVLRDATRRWSKKVVRTAAGLRRSSAEVITEIYGLDAGFGTVNFLTSSVNGKSLGRLHPAPIRMINDDVEQVTASPITSGGAFSSTYLLLDGRCPDRAPCDALTFEPAQYGLNKTSSKDACLAGVSPAGTPASYAWQADGKAISGATSRTYKIPASLAGKTLTCSVIAANASGEISGTSSGAIVTAAGSHGSAAVAGVAAAGAAATAAPLAGQAPSGFPPGWMPLVYGKVQVGRTVSCQAAFQGEDSVTYAWQANGTRIKGATASTYKIAGSLYGESLSCKATAAITPLPGVASSRSWTSAAVTVALGQTLAVVTKPKLSGPHEPGKVEKVTAGKWSPAASTVTYQWYIASAKVQGATKSTFTVPKSIGKGTTIHCVVTASAAGYAPGSYTVPSVKIT